MAYLKVIRPFLIQLENGASLQFRAGDGYVPDELADLPIVLGNTVGTDDEIPDEVEASDDERQPVLPEGAIIEPAPEAPAKAAPEPEAPVAPAEPDAPAGAPAEPDAEAETAEDLANDAALAAQGVSKDDLIAKAAELNVSIDKRWSVARIQAAIAAKD
jgi:hypothetical protein